ncbi:substrate-binding domain-containing protein [Kitasatospora sp. NPDC057223]|uniref:substrate-binding domain-containing protein n=1 Tax=Kitasatospora sp. NPDC057223 TaxID=3346055 RepID=UPI00363D6B90
MPSRSPLRRARPWHPHPGGPCNESTGIGSGERGCGGCRSGHRTYAVQIDRSVSPEQIRRHLDGRNYGAAGPGNRQPAASTLGNSYRRLVMFHRRAGYLAAPACLLLAAGLLTGCSADHGPADSGDGAPPASARISVTYLQKQGDQEYFLDQAAGAKAQAAELGMDLTVVDVGSDATKALSALRSAIADRTAGVIAVVPDPAIGPEVARTADEAGVALLASDDQICTDLPDPSVCSRQNLVPRVGFSGEQMGAQVGRRAGEEYRKAGWAPGDTRIVYAWQQDVNVCRERINAAGQAFEQVAGRVRSFDVGTDNTVQGAQLKVASRIGVDGAGVRHWVVWGCNDENVRGAVTALQNAGVSADNVIGVGLGGYLACKDWSGSKPSGMRAALFINGRDVGALAVRTMYDKLKNGKPFPPEALATTAMLDATTWRSSGATCG